MKNCSFRAALFGGEPIASEYYLNSLRFAIIGSQREAKFPQLVTMTWTPPIMMSPLSFRCPSTKEIVEWMTEVNPVRDNNQTYKPVECPACNRLHFIDFSSGRLLGEKADLRVVFPTFANTWRG